jgi:hypothetical protein
MPSGASVVRASVAVLLDQPFGVVAGGEGADGVSDVVDGLEDTSVHDLLLEGSEQALDDAIGLRLSDEGVARQPPPTSQWTPGNQTCFRSFGPLSGVGGSGRHRLERKNARRSSIDTA